MTGAGSAATPFVIGGTLDLTKLVRLDGNEPWTVGTSGGCTKIIPRCRYTAV